MRLPVVIATVLVGLVFAMPGSLRADISSAVHECVKLADDPYSSRKKSLGVELDKIDFDRASERCLAALADDPDNPHLMFLAGRVFYRHDLTLAFEYLSSAFAAGYESAGYLLGQIMSDERNGEYFNKELGAAAMVTAADARHAAASYYVALAFEEARPTEGGADMPDDIKRYYGVAYTGGYPPAIGHVASLYYFGNGVAQNQILGIRMAYKAWSEHPEKKEFATQFGLFLFMRDDRTPEDLNRALGILDMRARENDQLAASVLAKAYVSGNRVTKDADRAAFYLCLAEADEANQILLNGSRQDCSSIYRMFGH